VKTNVSTASDVDITILITCYNEEALITDTLDHVTAALKVARRSYEIVVVDDMSQDHSVEKIREYLKRYPEEPITLKANAVNRGLANNYVEGAFLGRGKYYRLCCGDDSEPVEALVNLFNHIGMADIVIPYQDQNLVAGKSGGRRSLSKTFTFLVNLISGYKLKYYNGSAIHLRYNVMRWHPSSYGFGFQADILTRLLDEGASYIQVTSSGNDRKGSTSTALSMRNVFSVTHTLLELAVRRFRRVLYGKTKPKPVEVFPRS
jgi:glycosyltransferase involved in cell wall biosynthesis